jgi:copper chaperone CopZ
MQTSYARTVEVEVYGMTCAFCAENMTRKFELFESVSRVDVSLKLKKIRLETDDNLPSIETINQTIIDAGFTPVKTTVLPDEK